LAPFTILTGQLMLYMQAIYSDVLFHLLGSAHEPWAQQLLTAQLELDFDKAVAT
jgi:hypothetical protein